jgi:hypothetical protein
MIIKYGQDAYTYCGSCGNDYVSQEVRTHNCSNCFPIEKTKISLWIIVDNEGRIIYTSSNKEDCIKMNNTDIIKKDCKVIELKGEY